jgi:actin related protein 2/3 complex subunit 5
MSIIQQVTTASLSDNWRTINIDLLDPESSSNFDTTTLHPAFAPVSLSEIRTLGQQVRQLLRGGDSEGALRGALEAAPYGGDESVQEEHAKTVVEVLQSIKASERTPLLKRIWGGEGGGEVLDVLGKYLFVSLFPLSFIPLHLVIMFVLIYGYVLIHLVDRYKGMAASSIPSAKTPTRSSTLTPQSTGFSQMGGRPGAGSENSGAQMSVLLSWHEKAVEVAGLGCINRAMTDWRKV